MAFVPFSMYLVFLFLSVNFFKQVMEGFPNPLLNGRQSGSRRDVEIGADATAKSYVRVIKKFLDWCKSRQISIELPFPIGVVFIRSSAVLYLQFFCDFDPCDP